MNSKIASVRKFEIAPDNQTSGNATWSYRNGNPIITFTIAPQEGLHPTTLTLMVNLGAFVVSVLAGLIILPSLTWSTDPTTGVFGWAADSSTFAYSLLLSIFPDCFDCCLLDAQ